MIESAASVPVIERLLTPLKVNVLGVPLSATENLFATAASCLAHSIEGDANLVTRAEVEALIAGSGSEVDLQSAPEYRIDGVDVVAARHVQAAGLARRLVVIDLDVHQGDGTAAICADDPSIFTLSLHGERNYPATKQRSDLDVPLPDGCGDEQYLAALAADDAVVPGGEPHVTRGR